MICLLLLVCTGFTEKQAERLISLLFEKKAAAWKDAQQDFYTSVKLLRTHRFAFGKVPVGFSSVC